MNGDARQKKRLLAVASAGGHWVQLLRLSPAFEECETFWLTTTRNTEERVAGQIINKVVESSRDQKINLFVSAVQLAWRMCVVRPDIVITTGAAVGYFAIVYGRILRAKTIWIDSIANSEELSLSGRKAKPWAEHFFTQWPELAESEGVEYIGSVV